MGRPTTCSPPFCRPPAGISDVVKGLVNSSSQQLALIRHQIGPEPGQPGDALLHLDPSHWTDLTAETIGAPPAAITARKAAERLPLALAPRQRR